MGPLTITTKPAKFAVFSVTSAIWRSVSLSATSETEAPHCTYKFLNWRRTHHEPHTNPHCFRHATGTTSARRDGASTQPQPRHRYTREYCHQARRDTLMLRSWHLPCHGFLMNRRG